MGIAVSSSFDSGNIDCVSVSESDAALRLRIRRDRASEHMQWFHFQVTGARGRALHWRIENAGEASYPKGWEGYAVCASYDRETWFRVATQYDQGELTCRHDVERDTVYYAYFAPYSEERHRDLIARAATRPRVAHQVLGLTLDGRPLDVLTVGEASAARLPIWVIARQHPGESMAEWLIEGLLERLYDPRDALARWLLDHSVFYIVPNMNPDGSVRGHLRTNAAGTNLNRVWHEPTAEASPEVLVVRNRMDETGVECCLDVHGDEALPYNFIAGPDGVATVTETRREQLETFKHELMLSNPDFQVTHGYPRAPLGKANMTMCTNAVADRFRCLAMTLEQPFKDTADSTYPDEGWSPARAKGLGRSLLDAFARTLFSKPSSA
ncbi:MAG: M14-type cytosolic carboxypeptidase [Myxococcota bacterium]